MVPFSGILVQEKFLCAPEREGIGVDADAAAGFEDHARAVAVAGEIGLVAEADAVVGRRDARVVVDYEAMRVIIVEGCPAMAWPEEVPVVAVGGVWSGIWRAGGERGEVAASGCEVL